MATSNSRDVSLKLLVDTIGQEGVDALRAAMTLLAKEGASAAPEVKKLLDQIDRLGEQSAAITALQQLGDEAQGLAAKEEAAATSARALSAELDKQRVSVDAARTTQAQANEAVTTAQKAYLDTGGALKLLRAEYDAAGKKTDEFKTALAALLAQQVQQQKAIIDARDAQKAANTEAAAAVKEQTRLETAQGRAAAAAQAAADAVQRQATVLQQARDTATALGIATDDLAGAQTKLAAEMRTVVSVATAREAAIRDMIEADRLLAIEEQGMIDLLRRGEEALQAEVLAQRDAARSANEYAAAKERATQSAADWQREAEGIVDVAQAAQRLRRESELLAATQEELGRQRTFERQAADAQKLLQAANYVRFWEDALDDADNQARATAAAAEQAAQRISNAFSTVGVRSVQDLRLEIASTRTAMAVLGEQAGTTGARLSGAFSAGEAKIEALERDIRSLTGQLTLADRAADLFKNSMGQIAAGNVIADGIGYLVNKVKEMGREFIEVTVQTERLRKGLQAIYRDSTVAAQQFQFLRDTANAAGFSIGASSDAFLRFSAATRSANLPLSVTNELFVAVTRAGTTLGLTAEGVTGTLDALGQMASKGVVSMEELRQQLGDRLPGALSLAAKGLGITDQQLIKLVESGQLATRDFFPAFAAGLKSMAGDTDTLISRWARFTNMLNQFSVAVSDAGGLQVLKGGISALAVVVGIVLVPLQGFVELLGLVGNALGRLAAAFTTGNFKASFEGFSDDVVKAGARIEQFHKSIDTAVNGTAEQTQKLNTNSVALANNTAGVLGVVAAQERLVAGVNATGSAFVQQIVRLQENAVAVEAAVTSSEKLLKAKQDEGKALIATANLTGDVSRALQTNALAATNAVNASDQVVAARTREVAITQQSIALINNERDAQGRLTSDRQAALDKLTATQVVQEASLEQSRQSTIELRSQALAAQAAAEAYADNSTRVVEFQRSMENAAIVADTLRESVERQKFALGELKEELIDGKITQEAYDTARRNLLATTDQMNIALGNAAKYENLYRDAVADSVAATDRKARADAANLGVTEALAKAQQAHYETLAREATALGNTAQAIQFTVEAKLKQIEAIKLATQIKNLELEADRAGIEIQIAALKPQDELYQQKKQELEIRLQIIKAKQIEAQASQEVIRGIEAEIVALRNKAAQVGGGPGVIGGPSPAPASDGRPGTSPPPPGSAPVAGGAPGARPPAPASPFSFSAGGELQTRTGIANFLRNAGVTDPADIQRIVGEFSDAKGDIPYTNNPGQKKYADGGTISMALLKAAEQVTFDGKGKSGKGGRAAAGAATGAATSPQPTSGGAGPGGTKTVNIVIGGKNTPVNVASELDSNNLVGVLRGLESAAGTAS